MLIALELAYTKFIPVGQSSALLMGTPVRIKVLGPNSPYLAWRGMWQIRKLDRLLSKFNPNSDISLINKLAGKAPVQVAPETFECLLIAERIQDLTNGAFDITLGQYWGLILDKKNRKVYINHPAIKIDLGGIGKGYAADSARQLLLKKGAKSGMIDMRSTIAVFGPKVWEIGIQHPRERETLLGKVKLSGNQSLATSGDYERGDHIIDPITKAPATQCQSVTIIGPSAAETDALATAVFILGAEQGKQLIEYLPGYEALIIDRDGYQVRTKGFILDTL